MNFYPSSVNSPSLEIGFNGMQKTRRKSLKKKEQQILRENKLQLCNICTFIIILKKKMEMSELTKQIRVIVGRVEKLI